MPSPIIWKKWEFRPWHRWWFHEIVFMFFLRFKNSSSHRLQKKVHFQPRPYMNVWHIYLHFRIVCFWGKCILWVDRNDIILYHRWYGTCQPWIGWQNWRIWICAAWYFQVYLVSLYLTFDVTSSVSLKWTVAELRDCNQDISWPILWIEWLPGSQSSKGEDETQTTGMLFGALC